MTRSLTTLLAAFALILFAGAAQANHHGSHEGHEDKASHEGHGEHADECKHAADEPCEHAGGKQCPHHAGKQCKHTADEPCNHGEKSESDA